MKNSHYVILLALLLIICSFLFIPNGRTPSSIAQLHLGFELPKSLKLLTLVDNWPLGFPGNGDTYIQYEYSEELENTLLSKMKEGYNSVSDKDIKYPLLALNFKPISVPFNGLYLFDKDAKTRSYKLIILDTDHDLLYINYVVN